MPAPEGQDERRDVRLTNGLFWGGVGIGPLAAFLLLFGQGGLLRIGAVLALAAVVLIGLSVTLRARSDAIRLELEEAIYEEVDTLRKEVREDIGTAARATHKAFGEKLQSLYEQLNAARMELEALRAAGGGHDRAALGPATGSAGPGVLGQPGAATGRAGAASGMVRHTETVQVTTRQTIVDPREGTVAGYPRSGESRRARPYEDADQRYADQRYEDRWSGVRAGDRWEAVREDDRGREVRMGERRAAVHADDAGTELRYEDRWAAVQEPRRGARRDDDPGWRPVESTGWRSGEGTRWDEDRRAEPPRPPEPTWGRRALPALPAGGQAQPLWDTEPEPERQPAGRWRRDDDRGYDAGRDPGRDPGYDAGYDPDRDTGYGAGYDPGRDARYESNYEPNYDANYDAGYDRRHEAGYDPGYRSEDRWRR